MHTSPGKGRDGHSSVVANNRIGDFDENDDLLFENSWDKQRIAPETIALPQIFMCCQSYFHQLWYTLGGIGFASWFLQMLQSLVQFCCSCHLFLPVGIEMCLQKGTDLGLAFFKLN